MKRNIKIECFIIFFIIIPLYASAVEPIQFNADNMEYIYKKGEEQIICRGHAHAYRSDFDLKAVTIRIYGPNRDFLKAFDKVIFINKMDEVTITGDYAEYNNTNSYAQFFKSPKLVKTNDHLEIISAMMESYLNEKRSIATGDVVITQTNYTAYAEKSEYFQDKGYLELSGDPIVYQKKNKFNAKKIVIYIRKKLIKLYNDVFARIVSEKKAENKTEIKKTGNEINDDQKKTE